VDSATSWSNLMSDRNGVGAIVIDYQCKRLEKQGGSNELVQVWNCKSIWVYKDLVRRARLPAGQHARAARREVKPA
jgi:hypothetical protein